MKIETGRNPFARHTIRRRLVTGTCTWCGQSRLRGGAATGETWQYYVDADSARESSNIKGQFCNVECLNCYHS